MKVLVFNGSPKREASDTLHMTRAFLDGMREAGPVEAEIVHVVDKRIDYCLGCFACKRNGGVCVRQDDMAALLRKMLQSDVLLFSFPLHSYGMPAPLKNLIDRTLPLSAMAMQKVGDRYEHVGQANYEHLRFLMLCGCGFPNSRRNFEPTIAQFELLFPNRHTILTMPESPMFSAPPRPRPAQPRACRCCARRAGSTRSPLPLTPPCSSRSAPR